MVPDDILLQVPTSSGEKQAVRSEVVRRAIADALRATAALFPHLVLDSLAADRKN